MYKRSNSVMKKNTIRVKMQSSQFNLTMMCYLFQKLPTLKLSLIVKSKKKVSLGEIKIVAYKRSHVLKILLYFIYYQIY